MSTHELMAVQQVAQLRKVCREITTAVPVVEYAGHTVRILSLHPAMTEPGTLVRAHRHTFYEAILFLHGTARDITDGRQPLPPGTLQLHAPNVCHGWQARERTVYRLGLWLSIVPAIDVPLPRQWPCSLSAVQDLSALLTEAQVADIGREDRLHARLLLFLARFLALGTLILPTPPARRQADTLVALAQRFIRDNLSAPLTLADIAEQVGVSVPTLTRQMRADTGLSVMDYIFAERMRSAARLLREEACSVAEVSISVGISDTSYFCRRFKQHYGCSPRQYRMGDG